jgi:ABC-type sugar transport system substrate-binding protein
VRQPVAIRSRLGSLFERTLRESFAPVNLSTLVIKVQSMKPIFFPLLLAAALSLTSWGCKKSEEPRSDSVDPSVPAAASPGESSNQAPIQVVGFDEHDETLQAIIDGEVHGTVVQNPYMYGFGSVKLLKELQTGTAKIDPNNNFIDYPARQIRQANAAEFWKEKNENLASGEGDAEFKEGRKSVAYVTNGIDPFWTIAAAGAKAAGRELDVNVLTRFPAKGVGDQKSILEGLLVQDDVTGVAVSPIDPSNQADILNKLGEKKHYITQDSDAPDTNRLAYIGMDNYDAGRMAGQLVKEALPDGGSIMIFVGRLGQLNAEQRRQGVIDELLDRTRDPTRRDPPADVIKGEKYTILGTQTDGFDKAKAKQNAQDAISRYPELGCMVGLFAYNPPLCLQAIREAGRVVKPVAKK